LITKKFENQLENFSEEEFRKLEELNALFMFLDSIIPLEDGDDVDVPKRSRKRRSDSVATTTTTSDSHSRSPDPKTSKNRHRTKRVRLSTSDGEDDDDDASTERGLPRLPPAPRRALPQRAAAARKPMQVIVISSDSEGYEGKATPGSTPKTGARFRQSVKTEEIELDKEINELLSHTAGPSALSEVPYDSIMGPDSEEEDEVNDLLVED
jgi:condensin complex subunit 3